MRRGSAVEKCRAPCGAVMSACALDSVAALPGYGAREQRGKGSALACRAAIICFYSVCAVLGVPRAPPVCRQRVEVSAAARAKCVLPTRKCASERRDTGVDFAGAM